MKEKLIVAILSFVIGLTGFMLLGFIYDWKLSGILALILWGNNLYIHLRIKNHRI